MPYTPTSWVNGTTPVNATHMSNLETQYTESTLSFDPDLFTAAGFVLSGLVCTKDGTIASQLDVAIGIAYLTQADATLRRRTPAATNFSTSGHLSTTMYLFLNNDGTWTWGTSSSGPANSLAIAQVTTDGSGNISTVTDKRPLNPRLLPNLNGLLTLPNLTALGVFGASSLDNGKLTSDGSGNLTMMSAAFGPVNTTGGNQTIWSTGLDSHSGDRWYCIMGQDGSLLFYEATSNKTALQLKPGGGVQTVGGQATAGSFGVPVIVAQTLDVHVTATTLQTILSYTPPATGLYRINVHATYNSGASGLGQLYVGYTDPHLGTPAQSFSWVGGTGAAAPVLVDGSNTISANISIATNPITVWASSTAAITVKYQNPSGTPNDFVTAIIERLS